MNTQYRGAPMGRPDAGERPATHREIKFNLFRIPINSGGYDSCGSYWGRGAPLYQAASVCGSYERWFRADDRDDAKAIITAEFPNAKFFR